MTCGKEQCQQLLLLWHRPSRSRSASLPFNCPSPTGGTNTDQFLSALLPLYYQVRLGLDVFSECKPWVPFCQRDEYFNVGILYVREGVTLWFISRRTSFLFPFAENTSVLSFSNFTLSPFHSYSWSFRRVRLSVTPWTVARQASLSMGFSRQGYWSGFPFPSPGDLPNPGMEPRSPALQADSLLF